MAARTAESGSQHESPGMCRVLQDEAHQPRPARTAPSTFARETRLRNRPDRRRRLTLRRLPRYGRLRARHRRRRLMRPLRGNETLREGTALQVPGLADGFAHH